MSDVKVEYVFSKRQRRWGTFAAICIGISLVGLGLGGVLIVSLSSDASHRSQVNKEDLCKLKYAQLVIDREARREKANKGPTFDAHFVKVLDALTPVVLSIKSSERCVPKGPGGSSSTVLRAEARRVARGSSTPSRATSADHTPDTPTSTSTPAPSSGPTASTGPTPGPRGPSGKQGPPGSTPAPTPAPAPTPVPVPPTIPQPPPVLPPQIPCIRLPLNPLNCP